MMPRLRILRHHEPTLPPDLGMRSRSPLAGPGSAARVPLWAPDGVVPLVLAVAFVLAVTNSAAAQMLPGGTPRSRGLGGSGGTDDTLGLVDNPASLGRRIDHPGSFEIGLALLPVPDLEQKRWTTSADRFGTWWIRLAVRPPAGHDDLQWAAWYDSDSTVLAYRGFINTSDEPYSTDLQASFRDVGAGLGFSPVDGLSIGGGLGLGIYTVWGQRTGSLSGTTTRIDLVGVAPLPKLRVAVEWFPIRTLMLGVVFTDGPYLLGSQSTASTPFSKLDEVALVGRGPTSLAFNATFECSAAVHLTAQYRLLVPNPPAFAADRTPNAIHELSFGGEVVTALDGPTVQLAGRAGLTLYNLFDGAWTRTASVYEQTLISVQFGAGLLVGRFVFNVSCGFVLWDDRLDFSGSRVAVSLGATFD